MLEGDIDLETETLFSFRKKELVGIPGLVGELPGPPVSQDKRRPPPHHHP